MGTSQVVGGVLILAVGTAVGFFVGRAGPMGESKQAGAEETLRAELESVRTERQRLEESEREARQAARAAVERADTAERDRMLLESEVVTLREAAAPPPDGPASTSSPPGDGDGAGQDATPLDPRAPRFVYAASREALEEVDWQVVGENVAAMGPVISVLLEALSNGEPPPAEAVGKAQQHNGPILTQAMGLQGKVPGNSVNGAFTHPAVVVNTLAAALDAAGLPLTPEQATSLERIGARYSEEDRRREADYGDDVPELRKTLDESELKHRFFAEVYPVLSDEQHDTVRPDVARGRIRADLFSEALVWVIGMRPVAYSDRDDFAEAVGSRLHASLELGDEFEDAVKGAATEWARDLPDTYFDFRPDTLSRMGMLPTSVMSGAAGHQLVLMDRLRRIPDLPEETRAGILQGRTVLVPFPRGE